MPIICGKYLFLANLSGPGHTPFVCYVSFLLINIGNGINYRSSKSQSVGVSSFFRKSRRRSENSVFVKREFKVFWIKY